MLFFQSRLNMLINEQKKGQVDTIGSRFEVHTDQHYHRSSSISSSTATRVLHYSVGPFATSLCTRVHGPTTLRTRQCNGSLSSQSMNVTAMPQCAAARTSQDSSPLE